MIFVSIIYTQQSSIKSGTKWNNCKSKQKRQHPTMKRRDKMRFESKLKQDCQIRRFENMRKCLSNLGKILSLMQIFWVSSSNWTWCQNCIFQEKLDCCWLFTKR
jgi:hypothetical protein